MQDEKDQIAAANHWPPRETGSKTMRDRKEVARLLHAQRLESLGLIAGGIAHDFNNILTGVLGNIELALDHMDPQAPARSHLLEVELAARRAADLSRDLLAYTGRRDLAFEPIDLGALIEDAKQLIAVSLLSKPRISYELQRDLAAIEADATQIRQILLNLVSNAAEAIADAEGSIRVRARDLQCDAADFRQAVSGADLAPGPYVCLEVSDTGTGMDEDTRDRIFQPFFTTKSTGRGLGLAAVLRIVQNHGAALRITSQLGKGTRIEVLFPTTERPVRAQTPSSTEDEAWSGSGKVLIVDDEEVVLSVASKFVKALGFDVLTAADGHQAVRILEQHPGDIDLALVDLTMPPVDGVKTIQEMRRVQEDLKTLLMSGYDRREMETRYSDRDIAGFIQKPLRTTELKAQIRDVLGVSAVSPVSSLPTSQEKEDLVSLQEELAAHRRLSSGIELAQYDTALRLAQEAESKSQKPSGRLRRISRLAADLSRQLAVSENGARVLAASALFHDIGEIGVSERVLRKPGPLSADEWKLVKRHPVIGSELLSGLSSRVIGAAAEIALNHHERWDGSGYPNGLAGRDIPLFARIVSLVGHYDAIRSPRTYKAALGHEEACDILLHGDARSEPGHFDPAVLAAFDSMKGHFAEVFDAYPSDSPGLGP